MPTDKYRTVEEDYVTSSPINIRAIMNTLMDKAWIIIVCVAAAAFLAVLHVRHATRIYGAKAVLQVESDKPKVAPVEGVQGENFSSVDFVKTIEQTLQSRTLFERVVDADRLGADARFVAQEGEKSKPGLVSQLASITEVRMRPGTRLIDVTVEHPNAELAAQLANSIVREFVRQSLEHQSSSAQIATELLLDEANRLRRKLEESDQALQAYKEQTQFMPAENPQNTILSQVEQRLTQQKSARIELETEYQQYEKAKGNAEALLAVPFVAANPVVIQLQNEIIAQKAEFDRIKQTKKARHPKYIEAEMALVNLRQALNEAIAQTGETKRIAYSNAVTAEKALADTLNKEQLNAIGSSKMAMAYNALAREAESDRALYQRFLQRVKETAVMKDLELSKIRVVQRADVPERPIRPQREQLIMLGVVLGALFGIGIALLLGAMDSSLKTMDDAEDYLRVPALSTIPQIPAGRLNSTQLIMANNRALSGAESFRSLRTSLALLRQTEEQRVFLFTSALPEEGKTFCSLNYAASLSQQGLRVLLIDCDLRRPAVEYCLSGGHGELPGVSDYLNGKENFGEVIHEAKAGNFFYMPAGRPVSNPSELLAQPQFNQLLEEALKTFDRVVIDSAPIFGVSDTLLVVNRVDVACLVVRACKTPRKKALRALKILEKAGAPLAGLVLNRVPPNDRRNGDDPYYDYGYAEKHKIVPLLKAS